MNTYRFSRWDGTQDVFRPSEEEVMDGISEDLMNHGDVMQSLRNLFQRGMNGELGQRMQGLREMLERLKTLRQEQLQHYNLDSVMDDIKERLEKIVQTELQGIDRRVNEARQERSQSSSDQSADNETLMELLEELASKSKERLASLPSSTSGTIKDLSDYDFMEPEARRQFQDLMDLLKQRMLENTFQNMRQQLQNMHPQKIGDLGDMLHELNQMLQDHMQGLQPDFERFMDRHGNLFGPERPEDLEELLERLQQQMSQAQSLVNSMSPEMRQELRDLMESALDPETMAEMSQLNQAIDRLFPPSDFARKYPFLGDEPLTYDEAIDLMGKLQDMDELEERIRQAAQRGTVQDLDLSQIEDALGEDARAHLEQLQNIKETLIEAGYVTQKGDKLQLTPKGIRKIGQKAMKDVFSELKRDRLGHHQIYLRGAGGEHSGDTKPYEFGDAFDIHLERTVRNALLREGSGIPVNITPPDFEIHRTEHMTQASTVLLLDQSRSMGLYGSFSAAKKVALALSTLIRTQFPRDKFYIVGFSDYAIELKEDELPQVSWNDWVSGTNMHHAFMLSRKLMARDKGVTRQILMVTDGEPTTHIEDDRAYFSYPPSYKTVQETLKEVRRCTQEGITINTFMLESSAYLMDFVDRMMRINKGRAFYSSPQSLGQYVLVDYVSNRKQRIS